MTRQSSGVQQKPRNKPKYLWKFCISDEASANPKTGVRTACPLEADREPYLAM